jgi:hypothetical protein
VSDERYPPDWDRRRKAVYKRDDYQCQGCGTTGGPRGNTELHCHHRVPISEGGTHDVRNLVTVCKSCHEQIHGHAIPTGNENMSRQRQSSREHFSGKRTTKVSSSTEDSFDWTTGGIVGLFAWFVTLLIFIPNTYLFLEQSQIFVFLSMVVATAIGLYVRDRVNNWAS